MQFINTGAVFKPRRRSHKKVDPASVAHKYKRPPFKTLNRPELVRENNTDNIPSVMTNTPSPNLYVRKPAYEGNMAERERVAQEEIERKKQCVAPAFNKGAYTYIASKEQALSVGR